VQSPALTTGPHEPKIRVTSTELQSPPHVAPSKEGRVGIAPAAPSTSMSGLSPPSSTQPATAAAGRSLSMATAMRSLAPQSLMAKSQARRYATDAEQHLTEGNPAAAANSLRLAHSLDPSDATIKQRLDQVEVQSDTKQAETHLSTARHHESSRAFDMAARFYTKAARGKSSGQLYVRAAQCLLHHLDQAAQDASQRASLLREAGELARKATQLSEDDATAHLLLGEIYSRAGMPASAISQLEKAASLKPQDSAIQTGLTRLRGEKT
jgi:tetratricopeptide (TPR) repeat protein